MSATFPGLVGRADEVERLEGVLAALDEGARCVAIAGEPGIGKTRLLGHLAAAADARGALVLEGRAVEWEDDVPFGAVVDACDAHLASFGEPDLLRAGVEDVSELAAVFPSLARASARPLAVGAEDRYWGHRAVRGLLEGLAGTQPVLLVLDDLQWADEGTVDLLASLLRRPPAARVLLALAFRSGRAPTRLDAELAAAEQEGRAERLELAPLAREEAEALFDERLGERERAVLYEESGGNPFFLEQLVRHGRAVPAVAPGDEDAVPPAVAAALAGELDDLSAPARALAEGAAVAGEPFELELAASIAELDAGLALAALEELVERDLARVTAAPRRFRFRHPLVRRAVYEGIPLGRRLTAHGRAAGALAARGAPAQSRARHVEQAASVGDGDAVALLREAGAEVGARAPLATARWLSSAARLSHGGGLTDGERVTLLGELADALVAAGQLEESMAAAEEAMVLLGDGDGEQRAMLAARCAASLHRMSRAEDARSHLRRGLASLGDEPSRAAHALWMELSLSHALDLRYEDAATACRRGLELARDIDSRARIASSHAQLALILSSSEGRGEADEHADRAAELMDALPDHRLAGRLEAVWLLASAEIWLERFDSALERSERGIRMSREAGQSRVLVPLLLARTHPLQMLGRLDEARAAADEAVEASRLSSNPQFPFWARWESAYAAYLCGDLAAGMRLADEAAQLAEGLLPNLLSAAEPGWTLGQLLIESGERERGHAVVLDAVGGIELPKVVPAERCLAWDVLGSNAVELGRLDAARDCRDRLDGLAARLGLDLTSAVARRVGAEVALAAGDAEAAVTLARDGAAFAERSGVALELPYAHDMTGRALAAAGRTEEAIVELARAEHEFHRFGATRRREAVARELRKLGRRVDRRDRGARAVGEGLASLSAREREVAELVRDRRTNREIAAALFVSDKTVESHLRSIFRKLEVSSRVDVARALERKNGV
jgi:DNA-binding CsgD family transcriptional regulator